jgi:hypothetical protein
MERQEAIHESGLPVVGLADQKTIGHPRLAGPVQEILKLRENGIAYGIWHVHVLAQVPEALWCVPI